jgi:prepilin peptidase CpaA
VVRISSRFWTVFVVYLTSLAIRLFVFGTLLWLAVVDVRVRRLPNVAVLAIGALFFIDAMVLRLPFRSVVLHLAVALGVFAICAALFAARMLGGGDAKLAAVIFLWVGRDLSWSTFTLISLIGTVVALVSLAARQIQPTQQSRLMRALAMFSSARGVPYGVALALGGGTVILLSAALPRS